MKPTSERLWELLAYAPRGQRIHVPESIAADLGGVTLRAIEYALTSLEGAGHLVWHRKTRGGKRRPFYEVTLLQPCAAEVAS